MVVYSGEGREGRETTTAARRGTSDERSSKSTNVEELLSSMQEIKEKIHINFHQE